MSLIPKDVLIKLNKVIEIKNSLFILAGIEGNCDVFKDLAELLAESNIQVYGLQFNYKIPVDSINSMARFYLNEIRNELKTLSFYLGAYSFGGSIAIELSKILEEENELKLKKLFLFDTSHCFFKVGAHMNFQTFKHEIINDSLINHRHVYTAVLSIYLTNLFGLTKYKHDLYENLQNSNDLDDSIDKAFDYLESKCLLAIEDTNVLKENKAFLKLLLLKSAPNQLYDYNSTKKLTTPVKFFKPALFLYSKSLDSYQQMRNSVKFDRNDYNLKEIADNLEIFEYSKGSHWTFIDENLATLCQTIRTEMIDYIFSKL